MKVRYLAFLFVGAACLIGGCGDGSSSVRSGGAIPVFTAPEDTVLVKVGDKAITAGDFRRRVAYETGIFSFTMKNAKQQPKDGALRIARFERQRLPNVLPQLVHCALLDAYLDAACGGREVKDASNHVDAAVRHFLPKKQRGIGLEGLAKAIGTTPAYFCEQILVTPREDKAQLVFEPESAKVSEKEIDEGLARLDAYTARAVASNLVIWASASNVLAQAKGGADFVKLGHENGESGDEASDWGFFNRDELEPAALREWAFSAKVGDIGGPFEVEDGLSIVKILSRKAGTKESSLASAQTAEVALARVNFPMIEEHPEPRTREHCRTELLKWKARMAKKRLFEKLFAEAKIVYPSGDKLDFRK